MLIGLLMVNMMELCVACDGLGHDYVRSNGILQILVLGMESLCIQLRLFWPTDLRIYD